MKIYNNDANIINTTPQIIDEQKIIENGIEYTVEKWADGIYWWYNNYVHRKNGPAYVHRKNGPAIECINGDKYWLQFGKRHREDGPAVMLADGTEEYWLNDIHYPDIISIDELIIANIIE